MKQIQIDCWLGTFGKMENGDRIPPCDGQLVRCHLIPKRMLAPKRVGSDYYAWDMRAWVWGCGGPTGCSGHHGLFDSSRTLRLPRSAIPAGTEELARELGLEWFLDRTYGERDG